MAPNTQLIKTDQVSLPGYSTWSPPLGPMKPPDLIPTNGAMNGERKLSKEKKKRRLGKGWSLIRKVCMVKYKFCFVYIDLVMSWFLIGIEINKSYDRKIILTPVCLNNETILNQVCLISSISIAKYISYSSNYLLK